MKSVIRKFNLKNDRFPLFLGQIDSGEINDDQEEYLHKIWEDVISSQKPVRNSKYTAMPGLNVLGTVAEDVFVPNANVILFQMFSSLKPVIIEKNAENIS